MTPRSKRLIVNADDLGRTAGVNRGIFEAHASGVVTSATLMVNQPAAYDAADLSLYHPRLGIGLHVALTGGSPTLPPSAVPSLVDAGGALPKTPDGLRTADPAHVAAEVRAQLGRFQELMGRLPTHFDTHHHSHDVPAVFEAVVAVARETGRPMRATSVEMAERVRAAGVKTTDAFVGDFFGDGVSEETLQRILDGVEFGFTELMCHPGYVDDELRSSTRYAEPRDRERRLLVGYSLRAAIQALGIRLASFEDV